MLSRRQFLALGGVAAVAAAGVGIYAWQIEPHWVEVVQRPMPLSGLPPELVGRTLLHLSDIHVGPRVSSDYLIEALERARRLDPDFVVISGDLVTYRSPNECRELGRVFRSLPRGRLATVAALGNHDYGYRWRQLDVADQVTRVLDDSGVIVLRNDTRLLGGLQFTGLGDFWSPEFSGAQQALAAIDRALPTVVLAHNPDAQDVPIWEGVSGWVLAGHTHGGQVKAPFLPPPLLPVQNKRYVSGELSMTAGRTLYISRGLGHLLQVRFNVRPEMTLFTLQRKA